MTAQASDRQLAHLAQLVAPLREIATLSLDGDIPASVIRKLVTSAITGEREARKRERANR